MGRSPALEHFGRHLECYADYVAKGIFPVLYLLIATDFQVLSVPVALIYLMAISVRYSATSSCLTAPISVFRPTI